MKMPKIKIHYSIVFLCLISLFTDNIFKILGILCCILFHELAHYLVLNHYKKQISSIEISIIGGIMSVNKDGLKLKEKLIINLAGVITNFIIIIILSILNYNFNFLITYNVIMIIFNLIPILPLDGYQILNDVLLTIYEDEYTFVLIKTIDIICLIVLGVVLLLLKIYGLFFIWFFLIYKLLKYNIDEKKIKKYFLLYKDS